MTTSNLLVARFSLILLLAIVRLVFFTVPNLQKTDFVMSKHLDLLTYNIFLIGVIFGVEQNILFALKVEQPSSSKLVFMPYIQHLIHATDNWLFKRLWLGPKIICHIFQVKVHPNSPLYCAPVLTELDVPVRKPVTKA